MSVKTLRVSRGGQVSVPAEIRNRWKTDRLVLEDRGDYVVLRPPDADDPVAAAYGAFADPEDTQSPDEFWAERQREEQEAEDRKWGVLPDGLEWRHRQ